MTEIILTNKILNDKYTEYVYDKFDIQNKEDSITKILLNLGEAKNFKWNIGVIYGGSGSGKSSVLKKLGNISTPIFHEEKPLISNFDWLTPEEATILLSSMGLSSVPTWLRPYRLLSNGEQYRASLAYLVSKNDVILIDEYTSVVDRDVAKAMSFALQKYIRKYNKKIILASCHTDILEWLMPDWTYSPVNGQFERADYLRQGRPKIELQIHRVEYDTWKLFKQHHYLTEDVSKSCKFFLFTWKDVPVGINAVIPQPSGHFKNGVRESRIVVLPEYQGLGLGIKMSEITASIYSNSGYRYFTKTVHPALGEIRNKNKNKWKPTSKNGKKPEDLGYNTKLNWEVKLRISYCHEYVGDKLEGYEDLLLPVEELRKNLNNIIKSHNFASWKKFKHS